eukprot:gene6793-13755_t
MVLHIGTAIVLGFLVCGASSKSFLIMFLSNRIAHRPVNIIDMSSKYVSPEGDPSYRNIAVNPTPVLSPMNSTEIDAASPLPKVGDIVQYPGKWKGEYDIGKIRFLSFNKSKMKWIADIVPLTEGKAENVYSTDRGARTFFEDVDTLRPVRSFFLRSENGYKIAFRPNSTDAVLRAEGYRSIDQDYVVPVEQVKLNLTILEEDLDTYQKLKTRLIKTTLTYGAVGTVITTAVYGPEVSVSYLLGSGAGALYLYLLGKRTDKIGSGYAAPKMTSEGVPESPTTDVNSNANRLEDAVTNGRLLVPVLLMALIAAQNVLLGGQTLSPFQSLSREQFLGAMAGFLTYRVAVLVSEVATELRPEDILGMVPGSLAEGYRRLKGDKKSDDADAKLEQALLPVVVVSGPRAAGRSGVMNQLVKGALPLRPVPLLITDKAFYEEQSALHDTDKKTRRYMLVTEEDLQAARDIGDVLYEGEELGLFGQSRRVMVRRSDVFDSEVARKRRVSMGSKDTLVIEGSPELLDALSKESGLRLLPVWISLQTKEQFIDKAMGAIRNQIQTASMASQDGSATLAKRSADEVGRLVDEAAKDVSYYMRRAPIFQFTLLNTGADSEVVDELDRLLTTIL